jgi:hypothetical protein
MASKNSALRKLLDRVLADPAAAVGHVCGPACWHQTKCSVCGELKQSGRCEGQFCANLKK